MNQKLHFGKALFFGAFVLWLLLAGIFIDVFVSILF